MPELPDITLYLEALTQRVLNTTLEQIRLSGPFFLRTVAPPLASTFGKCVGGLERLGKRIVLRLEDDLFLVIHLMIAGRLHWKPKGVKIPGKVGHAALDFSDGTLIVTEAGTKKRAGLFCIQGRSGLAALDPGGLELLSCTEQEFSERLRLENHTLKRTLTDPRLFSGIGNAYSDEILHAAGLSPLKQTKSLSDDEIRQLFDAVRRVLEEWIDRLRQNNGTGFPEKVTAFRPEMAVHGRYNQPCPVCGTKVQRIAYAENECNYCPRCQTGGTLLADRAFSRLLKDDWPRTIEELEMKKIVKSKE